MSQSPARALDQTTLRLAAIIASSDDAIVSQALDGTIHTWNRAAERMFGYTADEAVGRSIEFLVPPEHRDEEAMLMARLRQGEGLRHFETVALTRDGRRLPISLTLSAVLTPDGQVIGISRIARDVSAHKALERDAFRLAAIIESSEDAIVSKDLNGIVQTWNKAAERMFGYTADEMVGRSITTLIPTERLGEEDTVLAKIRAGIRVEHFETVRRRKDGTFLDISLTVSPIRTADGAIIGASKIARDITMQRRLMREVEEASRVKDEFLAMLSHELRTPLNAVLGYTRMLRTGATDEARQGRAIDIIERNANVLAQLVSDVLDVSSIVTGKIPLNVAPADLATVLAAAVDVVRPSAEAKGVSLQVDMPGAPVKAICDADRVQQVFWNLLSNAVKFTPSGGRVDVALALEERHAAVTVRDTGIGMKAETVPFVFQRFWQGEPAQHRQIGGLGLGLALARHFVELHGGTISARSEGEGLGATFSVRLPRLPAS